jgi:thiamine-phosphate pyrophosphorylase
MRLKALAALADRLNRDAGAPSIPALYFLTDPKRTPDPAAVAKLLPVRTAVIYRHFGEADRGRIGARLASVCRWRGLALLIAADPALAARVGAGVHWPERLLPARRETDGLVTAAAHGAAGIARAAAFGADACLLAPVFATRSGSGNRALGAFRASQLARAAPLPVIALGGINLERGRTLAGRGFAGIAAIDAFLED